MATRSSRCRVLLIASLCELLTPFVELSGTVPFGAQRVLRFSHPTPGVAARWLQHPVVHGSAGHGGSARRQSRHTRRGECDC